MFFLLYTDVMSNNLIIVDHPLVQHKLGILRDQTTPTVLYRMVTKEITVLLAYRLLETLPLVDKPVAIHGEKDGITVEGVKYGSIEAKIDKAHDKAGGGKNIWITVSLSEGKNREVRKVLEALGLKVNRLIRMSYGPFALGPLEAGQIEEVGPRVIRELLEGIVSEENMPTGDRPKFNGIASAVKAPGTPGGGDLQRRGVPRADRAVVIDAPQKSEKPEIGRAHV
mgnify:CR=1 FL=1